MDVILDALDYVVIGETVWFGVNEEIQDNTYMVKGKRMELIKINIKHVIIGMYEWLNFNLIKIFIICILLLLVIVWFSHKFFIRL